MSMQKAFQFRLHPGAGCTGVGRSAPECRARGTGHAGSREASAASRAGNAPEWRFAGMPADPLWCGAPIPGICPGICAIRARAGAALRHNAAARQIRPVTSAKRAGNCPLTGLNQGFAGFFVALVPLGIAQRTRGRLDCADPMFCRQAGTSVTTTNKGNQP
ncbi:hypothetical protein D9M68_615190 [compost metagenome]